MQGKMVPAAGLFGGLLAAGLVLGGWAEGSQIKAMRLSDRYVTVRGLTERTVKADVALWNLDFKESGDDLAAVYAKSERDRNTTLQFLAGEGVAQGEISLTPPRVVDRQANEYGTAEKGPRYIVEQGIAVQSKNVDGIAAAQGKTSKILEQGVIVVSNAGQPGLQFNFTGLNAIKPDMITEATKNARAAADRFAADSGSKVGTIRRAEQGVFSITGANGDSVGSENGEASSGNQGAGSVMKKVRIVTTVDYYLER